MKHYIFLFSLICMVACTVPLDFTGNQFFDVQQILESSNCDADCEETADCEGQRPIMIGIIDEANINAATFNFFLEDRFESSFDMEIRVDTMIAAEVFTLVTDNAGATATVTARLQGEDGSGSNCEREIFMFVEDISEIDIIE